MRVSQTFWLEADSWHQLKAFIEGESPSQIFVLMDENTRRFCFPKVQQFFNELNQPLVTICVEPGEYSKSIDGCQEIWQVLSNKGADRNALLINLGGGMITDLGAYAASVFKRGINFIHIPTSLLAMVDASIGGKCGINFQSYKNQIGCFNFSKANFICTDFLSSLEKMELMSGFSEMLKHALIKDEYYFDALESALLKEKWWDEHLIRQSIKIKSTIVDKDPYEKDLRKKLNFGHTIGHAIESYCLDKQMPISHGFAIAMGMICESHISMKKANLGEIEAKRIIELILTHYDLPRIEENEIDEMLKYLKQDKKRRGGEHQFVLLTSIGKAIIDQPVSDVDIKESLHYYLKGR